MTFCMSGTLRIFISDDLCQHLEIRFFSHEAPARLVWAFYFRFIVVIYLPRLA